MNKQQAKQQAAAEPERCPCREIMTQLQNILGISPAVQQHFNNSRVEFLKGVRAVIDQRIEHLSSTDQRGTKISVE